MSFNDCKISESEIQTTGVQAQADTLTGSAADNKLVFDALPTLVIQKLNSLIEQMQQQAAAGQIGVTPFDGMTAQTLQAALERIQADIGGNYGGADGAGKVGYTPSEGVDEDTVQAAIEAVQANLTAYIAKIKAATGAAEVGNAPIVGMTATNVQKALEELRENIDNIVSGIIPGGSITSDMLQDGSVTADKLGSDVTGEEIPTSASDPTSISSQLSNKLGYVADATGFSNLSDMPDESCICLTAVSGVTGLPDGWPAGRNTFVRFRPGNAQYALDFIQGYGNNKLAYRFALRNWIEIFTATPPQMRGLTLQSGFTTSGGCSFFVTQENVVVLIGGVVNSDMSLNTLTQIGTLPADACPSHIVRSVAVTDTGVGHVEVRADGTVWLNVRSMTAECWFIVAFVAGGDS